MIDEAEVVTRPSPSQVTELVMVSVAEVLAKPGKGDHQGSLIKSKCARPPVPPRVRKGSDATVARRPSVASMRDSSFKHRMQVVDVADDARRIKSAPAPSGKTSPSRHRCCIRCRLRASRPDCG